MMNEADFEAHFAALREHLQEVRPIFDAFCERHGFVYVNPGALGRCPRIRIERVGAVDIWFDLWMELDKDGRRFEKFWRGAPYMLSTGAHFVVPDGSSDGTRFQNAQRCFSAMPFDQVASVLQAEMEKHLVVIERWDQEFLKANGDEVQLRG